MGRRITPPVLPVALRPASVFASAFAGILACTRVPCCHARDNADRAARDLGPFGDADESETLASLSGAGGVEPPAIIRDRHLHVLIGVKESNVRAAGASVRDDVAQRLLRDSVDAQRGLGADRRKVPFRAASHRHAVRALELATVRGQTLHQPEVPEHGRVQIV